jgi:hypothetical protein
LQRYVDPSLSEWLVRWEPPSAQAGCTIALRGRKFGVSFTLVVAVGALVRHSESNSGSQSLRRCSANVWEPWFATPATNPSRRASPRR